MPLYFGLQVTKAGVPHLDADAVRRVCPPEKAVLITSAFDAHEVGSTLETLSTSFAGFIGLSEYDLVVIPRRPDCGLHVTAPSTDAALGGDVSTGRVFLTPEQYASACKKAQANIAVVMHDSLPMDAAPSRKKSMAESRSRKWSEKSQALFESDVLLTPDRFLVDDASCVNAVSMLNIGLGESPDVRAAHLKEVLQLQMPQGATIVVVADTWQSYLWFRNNAPASMRLIVIGGFPLLCARKGLALQADGTVNNLWDPAYATDKTPISAGCKCIMCQRHTKGYIHHLLRVHEMNSDIILFEHNLHATINSE